MVPLAGLRRADKYDEARPLFAEFDTVPYPRNGAIRGYFEKATKVYRPLAAEIVLSDSTTLLELPRLLIRKKFFFILSANHVSGYVHFSDLNNTAVKLPFFALFESMESSMWQAINQMTDPEDVKTVLKKEQSEKILKERRRRAARDTDLGWTGLFSFSAMLSLARHHGFCELTTSEERLLSDLRNRLAHADKPLVAHYADVERLVKAHDLSWSILDQIAATSEAASGIQ